MMVNWGSGVSKRQEETYEVGSIAICPKIDKSDFQSILLYQWNQLLSMKGQVFDGTTERGKSESCTYTDTLHATWFLGCAPGYLECGLDE